MISASTNLLVMVVVMVRTPVVVRMHGPAGDAIDAQAERQQAAQHGDHQQRPRAVVCVESQRVVHRCGARRCGLVCCDTSGAMRNVFGASAQGVLIRGGGGGGWANTSPSTIRKGFDACADKSSYVNVCLCVCE